MSKSKRTEEPKFSCLSCGEPWSTDPARHQSACEARAELAANIASAEQTYRVDFDAMEADPEAVTAVIDEGCYDAGDVVLDAAGVDVTDDDDDDGGRRF